MPHFHRRKILTGALAGQYENIMVSEASVEIIKPIELDQPSSVTFDNGKKMKCSLCDRRFRTAGIFAIHYTRSHKDLPQDKNEWRKYVEA